MYMYIIIYPLVNCPITMENHHHFLWVNSLFLWPIAMLVITRGYSVCVFFYQDPSRWGFPSSWHFRPALCSTAARPRASSMLPRPELSAFSKAPLTAPLTAHDGNTAVDNTLKSYYLIISNIIHFNNSDDFDIIHFRSFYQQQTALLYHYCT